MEIFKGKKSVLIFHRGSKLNCSYNPKNRDPFPTHSSSNEVTGETAGSEAKKRRKDLEGERTEYGKDHGAPLRIKGGTGDVPGT